jgi:hypothetical protein
MSTPAQIAANRLNSQKSTGPRSPQGKTASSANSLKTGLYARSQIIAGEDPAELRALADSYFLRWEPVTPEESFLVATLINADWLLRRYSLADAKIWDYHGANDLVRDNPNAKGLNFIWCREDFPLLQRRIDSAERSFHRALHTLERLQTKRRAAPQPTPTPVADPPPEAKPNFEQPQSAQQRIGFVSSFSPAPDSASPKPVQAAVPTTVTHPSEVKSSTGNSVRGTIKAKPHDVTTSAIHGTPDSRAHGSDYRQSIRPGDFQGAPGGVPWPRDVELQPAHVE